MIENMNKFEIAEKIEELKEYLNNPEALLLNMSQAFEVYDEIMNMPQDKDGGVPRFYISASLKTFLKVYEDQKRSNTRESDPLEDIITDDFFGTLFTQRYGKQ